MMEACISTEISPVAPDLRDLAENLPPKRVMSRSPDKSRSPSPVAHKQLAKSVSRPKQLYYEVFNNLDTCLSLSQRLYHFEDTQVVI